MSANTIEVPTVDSDIVVDLATAIGPNMIPPQPGIIRFEGRVVPGFKWLTDREFCMTGDDVMPIRVINLKNVKNITFKTGGTKTVNVAVQTFTIKGSKGDQYLVTRSPKGWTCTCKGFEFRKSCRHVTEAQAK